MYIKFRSSFLVISVFSLLLLLLAACGGSSSDAPAAPKAAAPAVAAAFSQTVNQWMGNGQEEAFLYHHWVQAWWVYFL